MRASKHYLEEACELLEKIEVALQAAEDFVYNEKNRAKLEQSERYHIIKRKISEAHEMLVCTLAIEDVKNYLPF